MARLAHGLWILAASSCTRPVPHAGQLDWHNLEAIVPSGETAAGRPGDYYLRNEHATFIIQRPDRELSLGPYGGSLIDVALPGGADAFGELIPTLALSRTIRVHTVRVVSDGTDGGRAVIEALGVDATNVYYNLEGLIPALVSYEEDGSGVLGHDPEAPMHLAVRIRYALEPGEPRLAITYTFENTGSTRLGTPLAFLVDARANTEAFLPGTGFAVSISNSITPENIAQVLTYDQTTEQLAYRSENAALSIVPRWLGDGQPLRVIGAQVPSLGSFLLIQARNIAGAAREPSFTLDPGASIALRVDVVVAETLAQALARGWDLLDIPLAGLSGCVRQSNDEPARGVGVGLMREDDAPVTTFVTGEDGCFAGRAPPGSYRAIAGWSYRPPSDIVPVGVPGRIDLTLAPLGRADVQVKTFDTLDAEQPAGLPCRLTLLGGRTVVSHPALNGEPFDDPGGVVARQHLLADGTGTVALNPGRYLAIVSRGPEFDRVEQIIDVAPGAAAEIIGQLHRVVDSRGWAASDFHVHSIYSPDSRVPASTRVLSMAAEGMDFWVSTDHDVVADFTPAIAAMGLQGHLMTVPGAEVTTFDTGHFNAYPLSVDPSRANGGSPDWAAREDGSRPLMQELFDTIHARGAFVQVNHPRGSGVTIGNYFTRAALRFDLLTRDPYADPTGQPVANEYLRYPSGVIFFSTDFDIIEVVNGIDTYVRDDMVFERGVEQAGHDWMSFLSAGRRMVAVANSDTHTTAQPPGNPRTMVAGHAHDPHDLLSELARGNALMTTGPMVRVTLEDSLGHSAGLGDLLSPSDSHLTLRVHVESPTWFVADRVEVIANAFFADPTAGGEPQPAVPRVTLAFEQLQRANGGWGLVANTEIPIDLDAEPFAGRDSWLIVRVGGTTSVLFPVVQGGGGTLDLDAETPETFLTSRHGARPYACTNPIFIDADGDGAWIPNTD